MRAKYKTFWGGVIGAVVVLTGALYYWMRSSSVVTGSGAEPEASVPAWIQEWERIRKDHLEDSVRERYEGLTTPLERARFWEAADETLLAGVYYYQAAKAAPDTAAWRRAGFYLFEAAPLVDSSAVEWVMQATMDAYDNLLEQVPGDLDSRARMGALLVESGTDVMRGIGYLREVLDVDPNHRLALLYLGILSIRSGQYDKARQRFLRLLTLQPQNRIVHYYLAHIYQVMDSADQAIHHLEAWKAQVSDPVLQQQIDSVINHLKK